MAKLKQSGAIVIVAVLILVAYYIFDQQDLISVTQVARFKCLDDPKINPSLCISCINRHDMHIANQSSIYVKDSDNKFKALSIPKRGILSCEDLLQFVSYELPMGTAQDIKFEELGPVKQIIKQLNIDITKDPVSKYEADMEVQTIAIYQIKKSQTIGQTTIVTYSSSDSEVLARYYGKVLAQCSMIFSVFCLFFYKFQQGEIKIGFFGVIAICTMVLGETVLPNTEYLIFYAISLTIGFYLTKSLVSRFLAVAAISSSLLVYMYVRSLYSQFLAIILVLYILVGRSKSFKRVGTFGIFCFISLILCVGFKQHHHWLSLPLRKVIQYTTLTISPLLMEVVTNVGIDPHYNQLPTGSTSSVTLPGFEQDISSDEQQK